MTDKTNDLELLRSEIDHIDQELVRLFNERAKRVASVGVWKRHHNRPIYDASRETMILEKVQKLNPGPLPNTIISKLFSELVSNFRQWELMSQELNDLNEQIRWLKTKKIGIIGLGLLGYSLALRFKKLCPEVQIYGFDLKLDNEDQVASFVQLKSSIDDLIKHSDILIIATPALATLDILKKYELDMINLELILDLASTKFLICEQTKKMKNFIGGHPLSGKSVSGAKNAEPQLFVHRPFIICPQNDADPKILTIAEKIIALLGSIPYKVSAEFHDEMLALSSHLPQMIATNLALMSAELSQLTGGPFLHGPAFSEMTRCASSNLKMWEDIIKTNKKNVMNMVSGFAKQLSHFQDSLEKGDISKEFSEAKQFKNTLANK